MLYGSETWINKRFGGFEGVGRVQDGKVSWTEYKTNGEVVYKVEEEMSLIVTM